jgi:RHS repeat-associated protein
MLDDSGIIHMNGRLYDAELGRMLSADPYVQVPEYSQNFNRYSYVLNNPLNKTDPTGYSWLSKAFHKIGAWVKENWRSIVSIALGALLMFTGVGAMLAGNLLFGAMGLQSVSVLAFNATMGAITGGIMGAASAALAGGDFGDILKGAAVGAVQGAISSGPLHAMEGVRGLEVAHVVGHGVTGGAANVAMGGKFQDGFLSAAAGAAATHTGIYGKFKGSGAINVAGRTAVAGIIGGTASALGGGKFANGAWTAAFQHLLNGELNTIEEMFYGSSGAATAAYESLTGHTIMDAEMQEELSLVPEGEAVLAGHWVAKPATDLTVIVAAARAVVVEGPGVVLAASGAAKKSAVTMFGKVRGFFGGAAKPGSYKPGAILPNGRIAGMGPGASLNNQAAREAANALKFKPVKGALFNSHGQPVFQKGNRYLTPDVDQHSGGVWKMFDQKGRRLGTYDGNLNRIGK